MPVELLRAVAITGAVAVVTAATPGAGAGGAEELARRVERRHRRAGDLTARFVQTYRSGVLGREVVERGTVAMKRPGRMRWEYREPEKKVFVSDGKTFYFYVPSDRQVIVREHAGDQGVATFLLSGERDILDQFAASFDPVPGGEPRLRLTPREPDASLETVFLEVDEGARIKSIEVVDVQGNRSHFRFEGLRENVGLKDDLFRFEIPAGVEVVSG